MLEVRVSIVVASLDAGMTEFGELVNKADLALPHARYRERNKIASVNCMMGIEEQGVLDYLQ